MEKRISDINRILDFLGKYGILCQKYWDVKEEDSYWEGLANDIGSLHKEYPGEFEEITCVADGGIVPRRKVTEYATRKRAETSRRGKYPAFIL